MKIIWLDDDYFRLQDLINILDNSGFEIIFCENINIAKEAIKMNKDISLFILDMMLSPLGLTEREIEETIEGKITGYIFYKEFIENEFKDTPVIILSAYAHENILNIENDNIVLLKKPIDSEELINIIKQKGKPTAN